MSDELMIGRYELIQEQYVVDAVQFDGTNARIIAELLDMPAYQVELGDDGPAAICKTKWGWEVVELGDVIYCDDESRIVVETAKQFAAHYTPYVTAPEPERGQVDETVERVLATHEPLWERLAGE